MAMILPGLTGSAAKRGSRPAAPAAVRRVSASVRPSSEVMSSLALASYLKSYIIVGTPGKPLSLDVLPDSDVESTQESAHERLIHQFPGLHAHRHHRGAGRP